MRIKWIKEILCVIFCFSFPSLVLGQEETTAPKPGIHGVTSTHFETAKKLIDLIVEFFVRYSLQVMGGIIVLILGWVAAKYADNLLSRFLQKHQVDLTVSKFMVGAVKLSIMAFAVIVALGKFGIEIAPLIAGISVAGFGLSFALQGPLSNFASGATLIFTKPFKVGDIIEVAGVGGEVIDIQLSCTEIKTVDGTKIVVPNRHIIGEIIHNYSSAKRVDIKVGVSYQSDLNKAIDIVKDIIKQDQRVTKEANVGVFEFADSSVNIYARLWCRQDDYWNLLFDVNKKIFDKFKRNGIEIPFPQRDVHLFEEK